MLPIRRKASFVQSFNEEDIVSANIRYFFPEGCQSPQIEIDPEVIPEKKPAEVKVKVEVQRPKAPQEKKTKTLDFKEPQNVQPLEKKETDFEQPAAPNENNLISVKPFTNPTEPPALATTQYQSVTQYQPSTQRIESIVPFTTRPDSITRSEYTTPRPELTTFFNVPTTEFITSRPETTTLGRIFKSVPLIPEINRSPNIPVQIITPYKNAKKCSDTCCDDNRPQILLSRASSDSCCKGVGKIVLPIDMELLAKIGTDEIIQITSISSNTEMLKKLLKLVEKYNF